MTADDSRATRRALLRAGGGALAGVATAATAGCFGTLPPLGGRVDFGRVDAPPADDPTYRDLLPRPGAFTPDGGATDPQPMSPTVYSPGAFPAAGDPGSVHGHVAGRSKVGLDHFGVGWADYDAVVDYRPLDYEATYLVRAAFDPDTVAGTLRDTGYRRGDPIRGRPTFARDDPRRAVAVDDATLVYAEGSRARDHVATVLAVANGDRERYHEVDEAFDAVSRAAGASGMTTFRYDDEVGEFPADVAATSVRCEADAVYEIEHVRFADGVEPTVDDLQRAYRYEVDDRAALSVEVGVDGRLATVEKRQPRAAFLAENEPSKGGPPAWPQVTWSARFDADAETVTVEHAGGDPVDADRLLLELSESDYGTGRDTQFADAHDTVTRGDGVTVDVADRTSEDGLYLAYGVYGVGGARMFTHPLDAQP